MKRNPDTAREIRIAGAAKAHANRRATVAQEMARLPCDRQTRFSSTIPIPYWRCQPTQWRDWYTDEEHYYGRANRTTRIMQTLGAITETDFDVTALYDGLET